MTPSKLIEVYRDEYHPMTSIGTLYLDSEDYRFGYTLEDTVRPAGIKVQNNTAIPAEVMYRVGYRHSNHLKREVLTLFTEKDGVTIKAKGIMFKYVYFHALNNNKQTYGCVGIGFGHSKGSNVISDAGLAEDALFKKVKAWLDADIKVWAIFHNKNQAK